MKKKWKRLLLLSSSLLAFLVFILLILFSLSDSISFFYSPTQALEIGTTQKEIRLGGTVKDIKKSKDMVHFVISDNKTYLNVVYHGLSPMLMQENIDVVAVGSMKEDVFCAKQILIKHDEVYKAKPQ